MAKCQHCEYPYATANFCSNCKSENPIETPWGFILGGLVVIVFLIYVFNGSEKNVEQIPNKDVPSKSQPNESGLNQKILIEPKTSGKDTQYVITHNTVTDESNSTNELYFLIAFIDQGTTEVRILDNEILKTRLECLMGKDFPKLYSIYSVSSDSPIFLPNPIEKPNEILFGLISEKDSENYAFITINPKLNIINVKMKVDNEERYFYESNVRL